MIDPWQGYTTGGHWSSAEQHELVSSLSRAYCSNSITFHNYLTYLVRFEYIISVDVCNLINTYQAIFERMDISRFHL
jgi:hypothetical protein